MAQLRPVSVPVAGGRLAVSLAGPPPAEAEAVVVLIHGMTANMMVWSPVRSRLAATVASVAIDLRGRGASAAAPGRGGMAGHADDVATVLDHFSVPTAVVVGHSMGAFVTTMFAGRHPGRLRAAVLVDGGIVAGGAAGGGAGEGAMGPALARLGRTYREEAEYLAFWRAHPAFAPPGAWNDAVEAFARYDLGGHPPRYRSRCDEEAVRADGVDLLTNPEVGRAIGHLGVPAELLRVDLGPGNEPNPLIPLAVALDVQVQVAGLSVLTVPGLNHYTILLHPSGADAVASSIGRMIPATA